MTAALVKGPKRVVSLPGEPAPVVDTRVSGSAFNMVWRLLMEDETVLGVSGCMKGGMEEKEGVKEEDGVDGVGIDGVGGVGGRTGTGGMVLRLSKEMKARETVPPTFTMMALVSAMLLGEEGRVRDVVLLRATSFTEAEVMA
ncbi:MAG: hypothetical protein WAV09_04355, partial [Minisyncoccia bacterium]